MKVALKVDDFYQLSYESNVKVQFFLTMFALTRFDPSLLLQFFIKCKVGVTYFTPVE